MQKELSIVDIALRCGFSSQTNFNQQFCKRTGIVPLAYRQQIRDRNNVLIP